MPIPTDTSTCALAVLAVTPASPTKSPITAAYFRVRIVRPPCRISLSRSIRGVTWHGLCQTCEHRVSKRKLFTHSKIRDYAKQFSADDRCARMAAVHHQPVDFGHPGAGASHRRTIQEVQVVVTCTYLYLRPVARFLRRPLLSICDVSERKIRRRMGSWQVDGRMRRAAARSNPRADFPDPHAAAHRQRPCADFRPSRDFQSASFGRVVTRNGQSSRNERK